ncbi:MAG: benzoate-CoA ligase family protein [Bdellovibrionales bacterium]|nr:benzoate-CoA ligase family protein [Bdellovibrionales bacterium]
MASWTSHIDTFAAENLPPVSQWPEMPRELPELNYSDHVNCGVELLDKQVQNGHGAAPLFIEESHTISYGEFLELTNQIANSLVQDLGLQPGNRVLLRGPNTVKMAACWFAVVKAGGICVTTMPLLRAKELTYIIEKAKVSIALCDEACREEMAIAAARSPQLEALSYFNGAQDKSLESLCEVASTSFKNVDTADTDVVLIGFTSGTTGNPKATMHFHRDVMAICDCFPKYVLQPNERDIFAGTPPFGFTFGLGALLLFPMRVGASIALVPKPSPANLLSAIQDRRATVCFTSPTAYRALLAESGNFDLSSLKKCVSAGEPLPLPTFEKWRDQLGIEIIDGIGSTEILHIFISASGSEIRPGSTGKPIPGYEAKIVDSEGNDLPPGQVGLLAVRGPTGCRYLDDERQKDYVRSGWNITGDAYRVDEDGYFWFQARADDMIISSGYNISGLEVESALLTHPEVLECGVVGAPDDERGHIVKAFIVLKDSSKGTEETKKQLKDFVKQTIAPYKYPRAIEFVSALPKTETGKVQRFKLREQ